VTRPRPAELCRALLRALDGAEGRRRRRQRDTTADALGLAIKRELLEHAVADDPEPDAFEAWLLERCAAAADTVSTGAVRAMALEVFDEWRLAAATPSFGNWLARGALDQDEAATAGRREGSSGEAPPEDRAATKPMGPYRRPVAG
jgi:hypothetical protein